MKKLLLIIVSVAGVSCSKDCKEEENAAYNEYVECAANAGANIPVANDCYDRYEKKLDEIGGRCE